MAYDPTLEQYNSDLALYQGMEKHSPLTQEQFDTLKSSPDGLPLPGNLVGSQYPGGLGAFREADAQYQQQLQANKLSHLNTGFGGLLSTLQSNPVVQGIESFALGPEIGALSGLGATAGAAGAGALVGAGTSAATGGNPLTGGLEGGALAGLSSGILNNFGDITSGLGFTGADTAGQSFGQVTGINSLLDPSGSAGTNDFLSANQAETGGTSKNFFGSDMSVGLGDGQSGTFNYDLSGNQVAGGSAASNAFSSGGGIGVNAATAANALGAASPLDTGDATSFLSANSPSSSGGGATGGAPVTTQGNLPWLNAPNVPGASVADQNLLNNASNSAATTNVSAPNIGGGGAGPASPAPSSLTNFENNPSLGSFGKMLAANAAPVIAGGGLLANVIQGDKPVKGENQINAAAATDTANGAQLQSYLTSGQLPPGAQASINQAAQSQKAAIKSRFAQMGSSGSSSEQQELAAVDQWAQGQGSQLALQLLNSGISQSQMGAALYSDISKNALAQDQSLASSIGAFASSLNGGGGTGANGFKLVAA